MNHASRLSSHAASPPCATRLALLDCTKAVQDAADSGQIKLTHAKALAKLTADEQCAKMTGLVESSTDATPRQRSRQQTAVTGERPRVKSRTQILVALEQVQGD